MLMVPAWLKNFQGFVWLPTHKKIQLDPEVLPLT